MRRYSRVFATPAEGEMHDAIRITNKEARRLIDVNQLSEMRRGEGCEYQSNPVGSWSSNPDGTYDIHLHT